MKKRLIHSGFTLIELLTALAMVSVLFIAIGSLFQNLQSFHRPQTRYTSLHASLATLQYSLQHALQTCPTPMTWHELDSLEQNLQAKYAPIWIRQANQIKLPHFQAASSVLIIAQHTNSLLAQFQNTSFKLAHAHLLPPQGLYIVHNCQTAWLSKGKINQNQFIPHTSALSQQLQAQNISTLHIQAVQLHAYAIGQSGNQTGLFKFETDEHGLWKNAQFLGSEIKNWKIEIAHHCTHRPAFIRIQIMLAQQENPSFPTLIQTALNSECKNEK